MDTWRLQQSNLQLQLELEEARAALDDAHAQVAQKDVVARQLVGKINELGEVRILPIQRKL